MRASVFNQFGDPEVLHIEERAIPTIAENEVLIKVKAAGVNRPDVFQRRGNYPAPKGTIQDVLGLEVAGEIVKTGAMVSRWAAGDKICALVRGGGYAEYVAADEGSCLPIPKGFSMEEAAALPEVLFTVWHNVFQRANLKKGESILVYGGSGGIGSMAIQLSSLFGAEVATLASSEEKIAYCRSLGAKTVVNYKTEDLSKVLSPSSFDVILDSVGGKYLDLNLNFLKPEGRLVYINAMEGGRSELDIKKVMVKRLHITGSTLRARSYDFKKALAKDILKNAYPLLENPNFQRKVHARFSLAEAAKAHALMESRDLVGKIVLLV